MVIYFLGVIFMAFVTDIKGISSTNQKITVTYHKYKKSWNQAQEVCETLGGTLFIEDTPEKATVLENYRIAWGDSTPSLVWIGLHSVSTSGSDIWVYGKPSCHEIDASIHSHWESGQTLTDATKRCGIQSLSTNEWEVSKCQWSDYYFVCERQESTSCSFTEVMGTPKLALSAEYQTLSSTKADYTDCRDECLSSVHNDLNCWAARYDSSTCVLYFSSDPFLFRDTANIDISSHQLFLKDCYISDIDTTDDTTILSSNNADPNNGCLGLATSTTISTTSSPTTATSVLATSSTASTTPSPNTATSTTSTSAVSSTTSSLLSSSPSSDSSSSVATTTSSKCPCLCNNLTGLYRNFSIDPEFANLTSDEILVKIIEKLRVNKSSLSSTIRKKTSAEDNRPSSVSVGVVAVVFMALVFGMLMIGDGIHLRK